LGLKKSPKNVKKASIFAGESGEDENGEILTGLPEREAFILLVSPLPKESFP